MTKRAVALPENDEKTAPRLLLGHLYTTQVDSLGGVFQHILGEPPADTEIGDVYGSFKYYTSAPWKLLVYTGYADRCSDDLCDLCSSRIRPRHCARLN